MAASQSDLTEPTGFQLLPGLGEGPEGWLPEGYEGL